MPGAAVGGGHGQVVVGGEFVVDEPDAEVVEDQFGGAPLGAGATTEDAVGQQDPGGQAQLTWAGAFVAFFLQGLNEACQFVRFGETREEPAGVAPVASARQLAQDVGHVEAALVGAREVIQVAGGEVLPQRLHIELEGALDLGGQRPHAVGDGGEKVTEQGDVLKKGVPHQRRDLE
ncbi:hypothetical protein ACFRFU_46650 [Streptomyces sp. NPDC056704]|uniref:hypothetical protein n=1 Tax=Streptomyces sp. NPDC056704 TaxID=3345917 RepID=UPI0036A9C771